MKREGIKEEIGEEVRNSMMRFADAIESEAVRDFGFWVLNSVKMSEEDRRKVLIEMESIGVDIPNDCW